MASETTTGTVVGRNTRMEPWQGGVVGGLLGGVAMGVMLTMQMTPVIENAIPAMYGLSGGAAGWVIHMFHAAILGVGFAAVAKQFDLDSLGPSVGTGLAYGVVLWLVLAVLVMPVWLQTVGFAGAPALPNVNVQSLFGHLVYGGVLGLVYPFVTFAD
ncbi:histidine kinase [Haloarchaeobius litoreus]|uniref:Histidine kinase n=1 Tax=Haloarchaeobius litoreus TaxID=755306 RepID=A0ABD6DLR0_9EURY|nr:histidine kinase [Haloarchaeobius litoreus]